MVTVISLSGLLSHCLLKRRTRRKRSTNQSVPCAMAPDGTGSATGKRNAPRFQQRLTSGNVDAELSTIIASGKNKMPAYTESL